MSLTVKFLNYDQLSDADKENVPNNGCGKKYASYYAIYHNEERIGLYSDAMEPEDARFYRDLGWIGHTIHQAYLLGLEDGVKNLSEVLEKPNT